MPKQKTHKGMKKRFKVTGTGKLKYTRPFRGHLLSHKSRKRKRYLRRPGILEGPEAEEIRQGLKPSQ